MMTKIEQFGLIISAIGELIDKIPPSVMFGICFWLVWWGVLSPITNRLDEIINLLRDLEREL